MGAFPLKDTEIVSIGQYPLVTYNQERNRNLPDMKPHMQ